MAAQRSWMPSLDSMPTAALPTGRAVKSHDGAAGNGEKGARGLRAAQDAHIYGQQNYFQNNLAGPALHSAALGSSARQTCPSLTHPPPIVTATETTLPNTTSAIQQKSITSLTLQDITMNAAKVKSLTTTEGFAALRGISVKANVFEGTNGLVDLLREKSEWDALSVTGNYHVFSEEAVVKKLAEQLGACDIPRLGLSGNNIPGGASDVMANAMSQSKHITSLDLSENELLSDEPEGVKRFLNENKFVTSLSLSSCGVGPTTIQVITDSLASSNTIKAPPEHEPFPEPADLKEDTPTNPFPKPEGDEGTDICHLPTDIELDDAMKEVLEEYRTKVTEEQTEAQEDPPEDEDEEEGADPADPADPEDPEDPEDAEPAEAAEKENPNVDAAAKRAEAQKQALEEKVNLYSAALKDLKRLANSADAEGYIIAKEFFESLVELKQQQLADRDAAFAMQQEREAKEANRMSGWSHLRELDLSANPIKNAGAQAVASLLREAVPKTEEELAKEEVWVEELAKDVALKEERAARRAAEEERLAAELEEQKAAAEAKAAEEAEKAEQAAEAAAAAAAEAGEEDTPPPPPDADPKPEGSSEAPEAAPETPADEAAAATEEAEKEEEKQEDVILTTKPGMTTLSYLDLSDCEVGSKGLKALANVLSDNNTSLRTLSLKRNKFGIKKMTPPAADEDTPPQRVEQGGVVTPGIVALGSCLAATSLTELDIGGNLIGPANGVVLFEGLLKNRGLVGLGLESNRLGGVGPDGPRCAEDENNVAKCLQTLSSALLQSKTLTTLRLRGNMLGTAGAALLAQGLTETCTLTSLDLSHNYLLDEGVATICSALTAIPGLTSLGLAGNELTEHAADSFEALSKVVILDVSKNASFGTRQAIAKLGRIVAAGKMEELNLSGSGLTHDAMHSVPGLTESPVMRTLDISDNAIESEAFMSLFQHFASSALRSISLWTTSALTEDAWKNVLSQALSLVEGKATLRSIILNPPNSPELLPRYSQLQHVLQMRRVAAGLK